MHPQKSKSTHRKLLPGFTLVELIIVITILAILGTIGFISIQGYSSSARDSSRISNLVNLHKGLTIFKTVGGNYPMPESPITITASGTTIGYQGFAKDQVANIAKLSAGSTKDPQTKLPTLPNFPPVLPRIPLIQPSTPLTLPTPSKPRCSGWLFLRTAAK